MLLLTPGSHWKGGRRLNESGRMVWGRRLHVSADTTASKTGLTVGKLDSTKREIDNGGISFFDKVVFCEPLDM